MSGKTSRKRACGQAASDAADERIGAADVCRIPEPGGAGLDGNEDERDEPEPVIDPADELLEVRLHFLGTRALVEIVVSRVEHDGARLHGKDEPLHLLHAFRAASSRRSRD